jgi:hypothetical protein
VIDGEGAMPLARRGARYLVRFEISGALAPVCRTDSIHHAGQTASAIYGGNAVLR